MGVVKFRIVFDKSDKTYYPGEIMTGRVELKLDSEKKIRGVHLEFEGTGKCEWTEQKKCRDSEGKSHIRTICHKQSENYFKSKQILIGGKDSFKLPRGEHTYPFTIMLPPNAPSSYKGSYGGILYEAKAKIDIPMGIDKTQTSEFTVINRLNLNSHPNSSTPYKDEKQKTFWCMCCTSGPLNVVVLLPKTGFATYESIPITLEIDNASDVGVSEVNVYLERKIHWKANGQNKSEDCKLQKISFNGVEEGQSLTRSANFQIPSTPFPFFDCCSIISMSHELHIEAVADGPHFDLDMHIPITIGHIPLCENPNMFVNTLQARTAYNPGMQPVTPGKIPANPNYPYSGNSQAYSQNASHPPFPYATSGNGFTLPQYGANVEIQRTSFLNNFKNRNTDNFADTAPLLK